MSKKPKFYVVWKGVKPGIYSDWTICKKQVEGFTGPLYKSFESMAQAEYAYSRNPYEFIQKKEASTKKDLKTNYNLDSICVDAACSGNPGDMEYRGVDTKTGEEIFRKGPYSWGTNNIGEFLAIVHGIGWLKRNNRHCMIYSDSQTAISWVMKNQVKTKLEEVESNRELFELIERAKKFLNENDISKYTIAKWETEDWGEIPADFGRK